MQARAVTHNSPCSKPLPDLEIPVINALAACLESEHRKFGRLIMRLALAAARPSDDDTYGPPQLALELWSEIQRDLKPRRLKRGVAKRCHASPNRCSTWRTRWIHMCNATTRRCCP